MILMDEEGGERVRSGAAEVPLSPCNSCPQKMTDSAHDNLQLDGECSVLRPAHVERDNLDANRLLEVQWEAMPFWRIGAQLKRIVDQGGAILSVMTQATKEKLLDIERMEVNRDLLPMPLPATSAEDRVAVLVRMPDESIKV